MSDLSENETSSALGISLYCLKIILEGLFKYVDCLNMCCFKKEKHKCLLLVSSLFFTMSALTEMQIHSTVNVRKPDVRFSALSKVVRL